MSIVQITLLLLSGEPASVTPGQEQEGEEGGDRGGAGQGQGGGEGEEEEENKTRNAQ